MGELKEYLFDWHNPKITNWKKLLRIKFLHGFDDIQHKGSCPQEIAMELLRKHEHDLKEDELEFVKGLLK